MKLIVRVKYNDLYIESKFITEPNENGIFFSFLVCRETVDFKEKIRIKLCV